MQINHATARAQYVKTGELATLRNYAYEEGKRIRVSFDFKYDSTAKVLKSLEQPSLTTIKKYTPKSGFSSWQEWINEAKKINGKDKLPNYLVLIKNTKLLTNG